MKRWTPQEDILLKEIYSHNPKSAIQEKIPKDWTAICRRARRLNLRRDKNLIDEDRKIRFGPRKDSYKSEEIALLKEIYEHNTKKFILSQFQAHQFDRSWESIRFTAKSIGLKRDPKILKTEILQNSKLGIEAKEDKWTEKEDNLLKEIYEHSSQEFIKSKFPNRTWKAIRERAAHIGLKRNEDIVWKEVREGTKKTLIERYGVKCSLQIPAAKEKTRQTNLEKRGVEWPTQSEEVKEKIRLKNQEKYGVDNVFQAKEIINKTKETMYKYGSQKCSQQQKYLATLLNGEINFPVESCNIDIRIDKNIAVEYDGGGHNLNLKLGFITPEKSSELERKRDLFLKSRSYSIIRIISNKDRLPQDKTILRMIQEAKDYLKQGHSWITFNIDEGLVKCKEFEKNYDFGELKRIKRIKSKLHPTIRTDPVSSRLDPRPI